MKEVIFYKVFEYSPFVVGDDNQAVEIFCGLSKACAEKCVDEKISELRATDYFCEVYAVEFKMTDSGISPVGEIVNKTTGRVQEDIVTIMCGGKERKMPRREAIGFFEQGVCASEGSEQERYCRILIGLRSGDSYCSDEY